MTLEYACINSLLHFLIWMMVSLLVFTLAAIGLFYQQKFHYKTRYFLFFIGGILILGEVLHFIIRENEMIEFIEMVTVVIAAILSLKLYHTMTGGN